MPSTLFVPPLTVTFLGTGTSSGVPMIACDCEVCLSDDTRDKRLRSSVLIQSDNTTLVIDTGPDFRTQMLTHGVKQLDAVLFTHPHKDHIAGLDDVRAYNYFQQKPMKVFANEMTQTALKKEFSYAFADFKYPGIPELELHTITAEPFLVGDIPVTPIMVWHLHMPVVGFRVGHFVYITDANRIEEKEKEKIKGADILVLNALRKEKHLSHFTLEEAIQIAAELKVTHAYFTHISHQLGTHQNVSADLPVGMQLAHDGMVIKTS